MEYVGRADSQDRVKIYSLYQEDYAADMDLDAFEKALRAWIKFIQKSPDPNESVTIEI